MMNLILETLLQHKGHWRKEKLKWKPKQNNFAWVKNAIDLYCSRAETMFTTYINCIFEDCIESRMLCKEIVECRMGKRRACCSFRQLYSNLREMCQCFITGGICTQ